jgi:hypothetical protein
MAAAVWSRIFSFYLLYKNINIKIHRSIILPVSVYGCKTWSFTLREEHMFMELGNRVLRKIGGGGGAVVR